MLNAKRRHVNNYQCYKPSSGQDFELSYFHIWVEIINQTSW